MNILTGFRQRDYRKALFSANGVTGVLFLAGIMSCAASDALFSTGLLSNGAVWCVLALLLLSIWLGEPLVMLLGLAPHRHEKTSVGMMLLGNVIVMGIEAALVCIQALRLEFYELFGRFYTGRGKPFEPAHIDYSAPAQRAA